VATAGDARLTAVAGSEARARPPPSSPPTPHSRGRAEFIRFANLPKVSRPADEQAPLWFWFPAFKAVEIRIEKSVLVYLPFAEETGEWTHPGLPLSVSTRLLEFGRQL
jgi:hypothetical protein